jgi:hypothetical protein
MNLQQKTPNRAIQCKNSLAALKEFFLELKRTKRNIRKYQEFENCDQITLAVLECHITAGVSVEILQY